MDDQSVSNPLVSVVIPTAGRPEWLPRAVASSLEGMPEGTVEVIVVPNGPDTSWRESLVSWAEYPHVRVYSLPTSNQNIARNYGLAKARGELIRFLDDDDYLLPEAATEQYKLMQNENIDVCSGLAEVKDQTGRALATLNLPSTPDFTLAVLQHERLQLPFTHVYRRETLASAEWPIDILRSEDIVFLIRYAVAAERRWGRVTKPVGVWFQHDAPRMSLDRPTSSIHETTAEELFAARDALSAQGRLTSDVSRVIAEALWYCIHRSFYLRPVYWTKIARIAQTIDADARPDTSLFRHPLVKSLNPILIHWAALPTRLAKYAYRLARARIYGWDYRRTL